ncbi:MAG TPA: DUF4267 domain-containing protein [Candidatus Babeliales bacterium]|nr:DUF4267 domain-containing protein [Candidatus Babeliales bacterium]
MAALYDLGWAIAAVLVIVGVYALIAPHELARRYGVSIEGHSPAGFVRATGIRDIAFGVILGAAAYWHLPWVLVVIGCAGIAVSVADLWIVWHHGHARRPHAAHAIHASGIVAFILIIAMALFAIGR